jgi:hypothetical protein
MQTLPSVEQWLLEGPAWVQYQVYSDFSDRPVDPAILDSTRLAMLQDPGVQSILSELSAGPAPALTSHKAAGHPLHKMVFLADLGLTISDPGIEPLATQILASASPQGPFCLNMNIPKNFGGSGEDQLAWMLCDAPLSLYILVKFGLSAHPAVQKAAAYLAGLVRDNGWPCSASPELGRFRGPGRKEDSCPYANMVMLKAFAHLSGYSNTPAVRTGVEAALSLWAGRASSRPYLFKMGTDFCKLKAPLVWYDILHVLDILTRFPWALADPRLQEMLHILSQKIDSDGRFTPESVWLAWKDWEFSQKKAPSRWLTLLSWRVLRRAGLA